MKADKTKREKEFVKLDDKYVGRNYLKYLHLALEDVYYNVDGMSRERMTVLLFISDYEFFTIDHLSKALRMSQANTKKHLRVVPACQRVMIAEAMTVLPAPVGAMTSGLTPLDR